VRIAVISSPRSGNSWIRSTLAAALGFPELAFHDFCDAPSDLPADCLLQIHWRREPLFQEWIAKNDFRVLTVARHPIDVLLSALRFSRREPQVARWLNGATQLPISLGKEGPASPEFMNYCLSEGAENLLSVTADWWDRPGVIQARYEDAVHNPRVVFDRLIRELGSNCDNLDACLERTKLSAFQATPNQHGWRGQPDHWTELVPTFDAVRIYWRHRSVFKTLGYPLRVNWLAKSTAARNWRSVA
jgi:hypothetical protein